MGIIADYIASIWPDSPGEYRRRHVAVADDQRKRRKHSPGASIEEVRARRREYAATFRAKNRGRLAREARERREREAAGL